MKQNLVDFFDIDVLSNELILRKFSTNSKF